MLNRGREGDGVRKRVIEGVKLYVNTVIVPKLRPLLVVVYGSFARGDWSPGSDIDLLVVAENLPKTYWDRWSLIYDLVESFPLDPHVYTPKEFLEMLNDGRMTALDALTEGVVVQVERNFLEEALKALRNALKSRRKVGRAWIPIEPR